MSKLRKHLLCFRQLHSPEHPSSTEKFVTHFLYDQGVSDFRTIDIHCVVSTLDFGLRLTACNLISHINHFASFTMSVTPLTLHLNVDILIIFS